MKALSKDEKGRDFDGYYTFPQIEFKAFDQKDHIKTFEIETEQELLALFMDCDRINICGEHKSGKSVLASRMYRLLHKEGK